MWKAILGWTAVIAVTAGVIVGLIALIQTFETDADRASANLSTAAEMFEVTRRVVFYNGVTDTVILSVEGRCSVESEPKKSRLSVTCKEGPSEYRKHYFGLADNTPYFAEQLGTTKASVYHTRIVFKPQAVMPDPDMKIKVTPSE